ncbi:MAG: redoxin domain-containing protein [Rhodothermales bacterium]|nr:redoxin domain-containing protein [Rhodothermales bacterium]
MSLKGSSAPDFELYTTGKNLFKLSEHRGNSVVLLFFPGAFTGVCTNELNMVNNDLGSYAGATVVGISTDSPFALAEFKKVNGLTFDLLSDHNASVCASYGAKYNNDFTAMKLDRIARRAAFVVDPSGAVVYEEVLESAGDLPDLDAVKSVLADSSK